MKPPDKNTLVVRLTREIDDGYGYDDDDRDLAAAMADNPCGIPDKHKISLARRQRPGAIAEILETVRRGVTMKRRTGTTGRIPCEVLNLRDPLVQVRLYIGLGPATDYSQEEIISRLSDPEIRGCLPASMLSALCSHVGVRPDYFTSRERRMGGNRSSVRAEAVELVQARAALYTKVAIAATAATLPVRPRPPAPGKGIKN